MPLGMTGYEIVDYGAEAFTLRSWSGSFALVAWIASLAQIGAGDLCFAASIGEFDLGILAKRVSPPTTANAIHHHECLDARMADANSETRNFGVPNLNLTAFGSGQILHGSIGQQSLRGLSQGNTKATVWLGWDVFV